MVVLQKLLAVAAPVVAGAFAIRGRDAHKVVSSGGAFYHCQLALFST